jgi:hypothetical protein
MKRMIIRNKKTVLYFMMISLLFEISADFVLDSISNKLAIQIQDIQQLIVQEQKKAEEQKALEQVPASVTVTEMPDGRKNMTINASINLHFELDLSGEIIRTYLVRIVDLVAAKNVYDLWKSYIDRALEIEVAFILILSAVFLRQHRQNGSRNPCLFFVS